ncbi:ngg1 interacting factor [Ophiostoma piceae UAMH 11346]|uniref:Ngg1 interacting factor n=1 Tax=Ophiostoma piceae (strain UAMH 11346) TaxID=1262450 RepID=S3BT74_OPHP1|nr:ngg1 interacting factor [Ophiostoma piceae UAMH 11346]
MLQPRFCRALVRPHIFLPSSSSSPSSTTSILFSRPPAPRPAPRSIRPFSYTPRFLRCCSPSSFTVAIPDTPLKMDPSAAAAVNAMKELYPEWLADKTWDNTGLLLANTESINPNSRPRVLLANDLSPRVVDEAIYYGVSLVIAYHPFIFRGLKSITLDDPQQVSLIRLAQNNIAVYSPHTALDAAPGGINDWLADSVISAARDINSEISGRVTHALKPVSPQQSITAQPGVPRHTDDKGELITGYGRHVKLSTPVEIYALIRGILKHLGLLNDESDTASAASTLQHVLVARPRMSQGLGREATSEKALFSQPRAGSTDIVQTVAICAGSGADVIRGSPADLYLTGEMTHHDALAATVQGKWVVCLLHSNSERLFLKQRLQPQLATVLSKSSPADPISVLVSEADHDPFEIWDMSGPNAARADKRPLTFSI